MKCFLLKCKSRNRHTDPVFLAQVPIMPSMHLVHLQGQNLGLLKKEEDPNLLLITDSDAFMERYEKYYQERFEMEEMPEDFVVPYGYEVVYGQVKFDNEEEAEEETEATLPAESQEEEEEYVED